MIKPAQGHSNGKVIVLLTTKMDFHPEVHQHAAGLMLYYDSMDFLYLRKYYSESLGRRRPDTI